jgi:hypothetical protein
MLKQAIPAYIYEKGNIIRMISLTAVFALVFINIYKPFSSSNWYAVSDFKFFVFSSLVILTGVLVVVVSRIIMCYWGKKHVITIGKYAFWVLLEIFLMSLLYTVYTLSLNPKREYFGVFKESAMNTTLVLSLPYFAIHLYFSYQNSQKRVKLLEEERFETVSKYNVYSFYDEKNELRLSVNKDSLLYVESADNYAYIWYLNKGNLTKFILRNSLKSIEKSLADTSVLRCHRSYMANFEQVKIIRRQKEGIYLEFSMGNVPDIPISKSYSEKVMHWFMTYSS